uniref:Uncharacterized protein n=1 Tax=Rhizophora mucronata TaxID=61149 RepID=A0A2P2Q1I1_RHIMU
MTACVPLSLSLLCCYSGCGGENECRQ